MTDIINTKLDANDLMQKSGRSALYDQLQQHQESASHSSATSDEATTQSSADLISNNDGNDVENILNNILTQLPVLNFEQLLREQSSLEEFKKYKGNGDKVNVPAYFKPLAIIQSVLQTAQANNSSVVVFEDGIDDKKQITIHVYNSKYFVAVTEKRFRKFLKLAAIKSSLEAEHNYTNCHFMKRLYNQFLEDCEYVPSYQHTNDRVLLNLDNCTLEFSKQHGVKQLEHNHQHKLKYKLGYDYEQQATAPQFLEFLDQVLDKDSQRLLQDYFGLAFARWVNIQSVPFLYGKGSNGKSVIYEIIRSVLGLYNVVDIALENLAKENYLAQLEYKLLNYSSDISHRIHKAIFKKLASQEPIDVRKLYKDPYEMTVYGRLMFNTNEFPRVLSNDSAFYNRITLIHFDKIIPKDKQIQDLHTKIIENESAGVLNWIIAGFERVNRTGKLSYSQKSVDLLEQYIRDQDIVARFISLKGYVAGNTQKMPLQMLFEQYDEYCIQHRYRNEFSISRSFSKYLKEKFGFCIERPKKGELAHFYYSKDNNIE